MRILIASATEKEKGIKQLATGKLSVDMIVTGIGMTATAHAVTKALCNQKYDLAINIGIAGSFREEIKTGDVAIVVTDAFADLGVEEGEKFLPIYEMGLQKPDLYPFWNGKLKPDFKFEILKSVGPLKKVSAISVNKVHGSEESIRKVMDKFYPDIESMEGAAFFYCCMMEKVPCMQIRAISNRVEKRNKEAWDIPFALQNLHSSLQEILMELSSI
jgi:futalosine hydrolase